MINDQVTTGSVAIVDRPLGIKKKTKYKDFNVPSDIFRRLILEEISLNAGPNT